MKRPWIMLLPAYVLTLAGVYLSAGLLTKHMHVPGTPEFLDAMCEPGGQSHVSCDAVLNSRWGVFPPLPEEAPLTAEQTKKPEEKQTRYPVAFLGLAYYMMFLGWYIAVGRPSYDKRIWHLAPIGLNVAGLCFSGWFIYVMASYVEAWCPLCLATHAVNLLLLVFNLLLWPRKPKQPQAKTGEPKSTIAPVRAHPSWRAVVTALILGLAMVRLSYSEALNRQLGVTNAKLVDGIEQLRKIDVGLFAQYVNEKVRKIELRKDDAIRYRDAGAPTAVVWGDFECSFCQRFAHRFETEYHDRFDSLQLVFRHYPLSNDCNPHVKRNAHPNACEAALLAEAVRIQGGSDKFWEVHDLFYKNPGRISKITPDKVAELLNLDEQKLRSDMKSDAVKQRILEDIEQGFKLGVKATPYLFLEGRYVNPLARDVPGFWTEAGNRFNEALAKNRELHAQKARQSGPAEAPATTPNNPDQPGAG